ncbi:MAG: thymidine phosphorylase [Solobacterium sp.]|nr:thymidine phosphorylase [Solobacterium sp.]
MRFTDLIEKKAEGGILSEQEIQQMITGYTNGDIPDYQMSAMCMAIRLNGMTAQEAMHMTIAMMNSGDTADLSDLPGIKVDKHSTGGVGDTTTLVVAPLAAACGCTVAKMSGRGLGHTGGTLDKLESIPGTCVEIPLERFKMIVKENGVSVIGQSKNLVPADKLIYALRDVTGTVRSIPLIASSIMSKKLASGADAIMLDVKTGSGAFMRKTEEAFELAHLMCDIGRLAGRRVNAVITNMNQPLGMAVGNVLEVQEAIELLSGNIPETDPLYEVCMILGGGMLQMSGIAEDYSDAVRMLKEKIADGSGLAKFRKMIELQGGDSSYIDTQKIKELIRVKQIVPVRATRSGYIHAMNAEGIGRAAQMLGAGRAKKGDPIDPSVGLVMKVRCGDRVSEGDLLAEFYVNDDTSLADAIQLFRESIQMSAEYQTPEPMVYGMADQ